MNVNCQSCGAKYAIADNKVHGRKVKVRCKSCNTTIVVDGTELASDGDVQIGNVVTDPKTLDGSELSPLVAEGEMWSVSVTDDDQRELNTSQVIAAFRAGQFNDATFIWKEGMGDWLPLLDVPEFQSLRQPVAKPVAAGIPRPAAGAAPVAARVSTLPKPRTLTRDLFSTASTQEEETAPAPSPFATNSADATGARNESSVLFSLDALKRQSVPAPAPKTAADDPFGLGNLGASGGGMGGFGGTGALFSPDAHALLTAPSVAPPPSLAVARAGVPAFDIAPPPQKKSPLIWIGAVVVLLAGAGGAYALFGDKAPSEAVAEGTSASSTDTADADKKAEEAKAAADADKKAEEAKVAADADKKVEESKATADADKKAEEAKPSSQHSGTATTPGTKPTANPAAVAAATPKPGKAKPAEAAEPSGGGSTFNVGAAKTALAAAAGQAASCKKGDQGGSGKATVTFSPSGLASSVTISGISGFASNCVNGLFRRARVPAFTGAPVTVSKGFKIPE